MGTTIQAIPCPLLVDKKKLSEEDRLCHIPRTRLQYLDRFPGTPCHTDGACQVCSACPQEVAREREFLEEEVAKTRRRHGIKWSEEMRA